MTSLHQWNRWFLLFVFVGFCLSCGLQGCFVAPPPCALCKAAADCPAGQQCVGGYCENSGVYSCLGGSRKGGELNDRERAALRSLMKVLKFNTDTKLLQVVGANLQIVNGSDKTETLNGLGNLILGYNAQRPELKGKDERKGSHNLILGDGHQYASYSGIVAGKNNSLFAPFSSILGGLTNTTRAAYSVIIAGENNETNGLSSVIVAGRENEAGGLASVVVGGEKNKAGTPGRYTAVLGGKLNIADADTSVVSGGQNNKAHAFSSVVSGGESNEVYAVFASICGGQENIIGEKNGGDVNAASASSIVGGRLNRILSKLGTIAGGKEITLSGELASSLGGRLSKISGREAILVGGVNVSITGNGSVSMGGADHKVKGASSVLLGGDGNEILATARSSVMLGGRFNKLNGLYSAIIAGKSVQNSSSDFSCRITCP